MSRAILRTGIRAAADIACQVTVENLHRSVTYDVTKLTTTKDGVSREADVIIGNRCIGCFVHRYIERVLHIVRLLELQVERC